MMTCAGKLNYYVELQSQSTAQDAAGEEVESFATLANVWAERMSRKVSERYIDDQFSGKRSSVWRIRYRSDVDNLDRLVYNSVNYDIIGVYEEGKERDLIIVTEAIL